MTNFQLVHEKLFHMFVIGQDLEFFVHNHPVFKPDGTFRYDNLTLPKAGMYRVLGDFYPDGATPQLIAKTMIVPGTPPAPVHLSRDYSPKDADNMQVEFRTDPPQVIAGLKTQLHFTVKPGDGLEKYLGAWGHMLAASEDLIDLIHTHPFIADGGPNIQFNLTFPRPGELSGVGPVPAQRRSEHRALRHPCPGIAITAPLLSRLCRCFRAARVIERFLPGRYTLSADHSGDTWP